MAKEVFVLTKTFTTCDGSDTDVYGVFNDEGLAKEKMVELIEETYNDRLEDLRDDYYDEENCEEMAQEEFKSWIDDRYNSPTIWADIDDDCSTTFVIHKTWFYL